MTDGYSPDAVAYALRMPQDAVVRLLEEVADSPEILEPSVDEAVSRALLGQIDRDQMIEQLRGLRIRFAPTDDYPDSGWVQLRLALQAGLLSRAEAEWVAGAAAERMVVRVLHSMDLEARPVSDGDARALLDATTAALLASLT
ncbi:hypothetical protein ASD11_15060 [Aeromicrobium sp. Root495]|nr:hypothetical protein ASD11_15060 [Aeromicrobium sp. Root495]